MIEPSTDNEYSYSAMTERGDWNVFCTRDYFSLMHYQGDASITHRLTINEAKEIIELLQAGIQWTLNAQHSEQSTATARSE